MQCDKIGYSTEIKAKQTANLWRKKGKPMRAYFHKDCGTWHLTKK
jgi:hypothetical protein